MIKYFMDMDIEKQTWIVLGISWLILAVSAAIREKIPVPECRNWARILGVIGVGLVSLQTIHATMLVEKLSTELMVRRGFHDVEQNEAVATQISNQSGFVALAQEYIVNTASGNTVSVSKYSDGHFGPVSFGARRSQLNDLHGRNDGGKPSITDGAIGSAGGFARTMQIDTSF